MAATSFVLFCLVSASAACFGIADVNESCVGETCSSILADGEAHSQGLEMLQLKSVSKTADDTDIEEFEDDEGQEALDLNEDDEGQEAFYLDEDAEQKFVGQMCHPKSAGYNKFGSKMTGAECAAKCEATSGCKFFSHLTNMDKKAGVCTGCAQAKFKTNGKYTTMEPSDLAPAKPKCEFAAPNNGPCDGKANTYCGPADSKACRDVGGSSFHRRRTALKVFPGSASGCSCGGTTWCRDCLLWPVGTTNPEDVKQYMKYENGKVAWDIPRWALLPEFMECCDTKPAAQSGVHYERPEAGDNAPKCCNTVRDTLRTQRCPNTDKANCRQDFHLQRNLCQKLSWDAPHRAKQGLPHICNYYKPK